MYVPVHVMPPLPSVKLKERALNLISGYLIVNGEKQAEPNMQCEEWRMK